MTLNNWKMIAETRSYIFRWRSRFRWHRVCLSSLMSTVELLWLKHFAPVRFNSNLFVALRIDIIFSFLSALFQWSCFVWMIPFLVVFRLTRSTINCDTFILNLVSNSQMKRNGRYLRLQNNWNKSKQYNSTIIWNIAQDNSVFSICIYSKSRKYETVGHGIFWKWFVRKLAMWYVMICIVVNFSSVEPL